VAPRAAEIGKRHPFYFKYEVGFNSEGQIKSLLVDMYADGGAYTDLSPSILDRAMFHVDGCYYLENVLVNGQVLKTNTPSNTAFRGFGGPQGTFLIENILEEISRFLKKDASEVRWNNLYNSERNSPFGNCDVTHYGQQIEKNILPELFQALIKKSDYQKRKAEIQNYNNSTDSHQYK
jgi:xanthine dehydrogenase large subunit